jgi:hypothetical protein
MATEDEAPEPRPSPWFHRDAPAAPAQEAHQQVTASEAAARSQQAGLAAVIALARADAATVYEPTRPWLPWHAHPAPPLATESAVPPWPGRPRDSDEHPSPARPSPGAPATTARRSAAIAAASTSGAGLRLSRVMSYLQSPLLLTILTVQAVLSLRLVWSNTAFLDEATYLAAGHAEIAHWLHGTPVAPYPTFFSGAPVIYPPIAALAASVGGLAAARLLSLAFMLGTTALLWSTTARLFGRSAAVCATALFAVLGPTLRLGAFATYDAMALLLLAASAWCMVAARNRDDSAPLLVAGTVLLALANATKYATLIFDPSVIAIAGLAIGRPGVMKPAVARMGYVAAGVVGLLSVLLAVGGPGYSTGLLFSTLARARGDNRPLAVADDAWNWIGIVCVIALVGVMVCSVRRDGRIRLALLSVLAVSGLLAPLNQARIHSTVSLSKHVDIGAWFAAVAAGYALSRLTPLSRRKALQLAATGVVAVAVVVPGAMTGQTQSWAMFHNWPDSTGLVADMRALTIQYPGHYLAEDYDVLTYYLENRTSWQQWSGTWYFRYSPPGDARPLTDLAAYRAAITRHFFSLIVLDFEATPQTDQALTADIRESGGYKVVDVVPSSVGQYTIWAYQPPHPPGSTSDHG